MLNTDLHQWDLYSEDSLNGIRQNGFLSKFKILSGYSGAGSGIRNLKTRIQADMGISNSVLSILNSSLLIQDYDDLSLDIDWTSDTTSGRFSRYTLVSDPEEYRLGYTLIYDLYNLLIEKGDANQRLQLSLSNGSTYILKGRSLYDSGVVTISIFMIDDDGNEILWAQSQRMDSVPPNNKVAISRFIKSATGDKVITNADLLLYVRDNYELMDMMQEALVLDVEDLFETYDLSAAFSKYNKSNSLNSTARDELVSIAAVSGLNGVVGYIKKIYNDLSTVDNDGSGLIALSDNTNFISNSILTGFFNAVSQVISAIIMVIVAVAGLVLKIIAGIFTLLYTLVKTVLNMVDQTKASNDDSMYAESICPLAVGHRDITIDNDNTNLLNQPSIYKTLISEHMPLMIHTHAGYYICSSDGTIIRLEKHIDFYDRISKVVEMYRSGEQVIACADAYDTNSSLSFALIRSILNDPNEDIVLEEHCFPNQDAGLLSDEDDFKLRAILAFNLIYDLILADVDFGSHGPLYVFTTVTNDTVDHALIMRKLNGVAMSDWNSATQAENFSDLVLGIIDYVYGSVNDPDYLTAADALLTWDTIIDLSIYINEHTLSGVYNTEHYDFGYLPTNFDSFLTVFNNVNCTYDIVPFSSKISSIYKIPKLNAGRLLAELAGIAVGVLAVTALTVVTSLKIKRTIDKIRLKKTLRVEQAWDRAKSNPDDPDAVNAYRKAVFHNNLFASIFGGTKYSKTSYWVTSDATGTGSGSKLVSSVLTGRTDVDGSVMDVSRIEKLITG